MLFNGEKEKFWKFCCQKIPLIYGNIFNSAGKNNLQAAFMGEKREKRFFWKYITASKKSTG